MCELTFWLLGGLLMLFTFREELRLARAEPRFAPTESPVLHRTPGPALQPYVRTEEQRRKLVLAAFHEAAHVVVLRTLLPHAFVLEVTIVPDGTFAGSVTTLTFKGQRPPTPAERRLELRAHAASNLAGMCVEELLGVPSLPAIRGALIDLLCARDRADLLVAYGHHPTLRSRFGLEKDRQTRTLIELHLLTTKTLRRRWGAVEALAAALLEHGTLDGSAAIRTFEKRRTPRPWRRAWFARLRARLR